MFAFPLFLFQGAGEGNKRAKEKGAKTQKRRHEGIVQNSPVCTLESYISSLFIPRRVMLNTATFFSTTLQDNHIVVKTNKQTKNNCEQ